MRVIFILLAVAPCLVAAGEFYHENIIIGAGPAGLQLGYYMNKADRKYVILERSDIVASFFRKFPIHGLLISINKRHTTKKNKEFKLRHDWNSLISDDDSLRFGRYTEDYFPRKEVLVDYMSDFQKKHDIGPIHFNTEVGEIRPEYNETFGRDTFAMEDQNGNTWRCKNLVVATGMSVPVSPRGNIEGMEYAEQYADLNLDPKGFENKGVLILGNGNAGFEVADTALKHATFVHMLGRSRVKMSFSTHYKGHVRAINTEFLDNYLLKSEGGVVELFAEQLKYPRVNNGTQFMALPATPELKKIFSKLDYRNRIPYDRLILCLGFRFNNSIFSENMPFKYEKLDKFPHIKHNYESVDQPGLFFAGGIVHSLDRPKASGAFITGLRYTAGALFNILEYRNYGVPWPSAGKLPLTGLVNKLLLRFSETSDMWHMPGFLGDVIFSRDGGNTFEYLEKFPVHLLPEIEKHTGRKPDKEGVIVALIHFGLNYTGDVKDTMKEGRNGLPTTLAHTSGLIHPALYHYKNLPTQADFDARNRMQIMPRADHMLLVVADAHMTWDFPHSHFLVARRFFENAFKKDMRAFYGEDCMVYALTHKTLPATCQFNKFQNQKAIIRGKY